MNNELEKQVYAAVKQMLADTDSHKTTLKTAVKFLHRALKASGFELKEECLYILGNSIKWSGQDHIEIKKTLRRYAFHPAIRSKSKTKKGR